MSLLSRRASHILNDNVVEFIRELKISFNFSQKSRHIREIGSEIFLGAKLRSASLSRRTPRSDE